MRVGVVYPPHTQVDPETGEERQVEESIAAYGGQGRIAPFANPLNGEEHTAEEVAIELLKRAKAEHPDKEVRLEYLVHNGDGEGEGEDPQDPYEAGTSRWCQAHEVPEGAISPKRGGQIVRTLSADQGQEAT